MWQQDRNRKGNPVFSIRIGVVGNCVWWNKRRAGQLKWIIWWSVWVEVYLRVRFSVEHGLFKLEKLQSNTFLVGAGTAASRLWPWKMFVVYSTTVWTVCFVVCFFSYNKCSHHSVLTLKSVFPSTIHGKMEHFQILTSECTTQCWIDSREYLGEVSSGIVANYSVIRAVGSLALRWNLFHMYTNDLLYIAYSRYFSSAYPNTTFPLQIMTYKIVISKINFFPWLLDFQW